MNNILFVIDHNSKEEVHSLIVKSDFINLNIKNIFIISNGNPLTQLEKSVLENASEVKNISINFITIENFGYAAAINYCFKIIDNKCNNYNYAFFSNADIYFTKDNNKYNFINFDVVGFPMYENSKFTVSKINIFTPFLPFRIRNRLNTSPTFGKCKIVHGCLFGIRIDFIINNIKIKFYEEYFLYWEETRFFYELSKTIANIGVSDSIRVSHDGLKSVKRDDARYYMFRNGLDFYRNVVGSKIMFLAWKYLNYFFALLSKKDGDLPNWYKDAVNHYKKNFFGNRYKI